MTTVVESERSQFFESKDVESIVLEYILNEVIESMQEETFRAKNGEHIDVDEVEWELLEAIESHNERVEQENFKVPMQFVDGFRVLAFDTLFGEKTFRQGAEIVVKDSVKDSGLPCFFQADLPVINGPGRTVVSKCIGRLVKIKNQSSNEVTESYYLDRWFTVPSASKKEPAKGDSNVMNLTVDKLKDFPCYFTNALEKLATINLFRETDDLKVGDRITHVSSGISYYIGSFDKDGRIELAGAEHKGNFHPRKEFRRFENDVLTKDWKPIKMGDELEFTANSLEAAMSQLGWSFSGNTPVGGFPAFYAWRRALFSSKFRVVDSEFPNVFLVPATGPLSEVWKAGEFVLCVRAEMLVNDRTKVFSGSTSSDVATTAKFKTKWEKEKEEEEANKKYDKEHGPYNLDHWKDKLIRINWKSWTSFHGECGLVKAVDNELGRVEVKFNVGRTYDTFFFRASTDELANLEILGDFIYNDEAGIQPTPEG